MSFPEHDRAGHDFSSLFPPFPRIVSGLRAGGFLPPAEGFMLFEQKEKTDAPLPQLQPQPGQVIINLNGPWDYRIGETRPFP